MAGVAAGTYAATATPDDPQPAQPPAQQPGEVATMTSGPDAIFAHPRLAQLYDAFDGPRDDLAAHLAIAAIIAATCRSGSGHGTGCMYITYPIPQPARRQKGNNHGRRHDHDRDNRQTQATRPARRQ
jgi:hypothetical protein